MRKDHFEILYELPYVRWLCKMYLKLKERVRGNVRRKIGKNIEVQDESKLSIRDSGSQPYAEFVIQIENRNFSTLQVDAFTITLSFSRNNSFFKNFFWSRDGVSKPPENIYVGEIDAKGDGIIRFQTMLPYYLYFVNKDTTIFISGTLKFLSDAGHIEHGFSTKARLEREELRNRTTTYGRLMESFSLPGMDTFNPPWSEE